MWRKAYFTFMRMRGTVYSVRDTDFIIRTVRAPLGLWRWPWQPRHRRWSVATGGGARDVTHSITSIIQSFVNKCNNSNSCKLFYLDYKSANSQITSNAIQALPLDWQVWAQENTVYSAFSIFISWWVMDLVGKPNTKSLIWNHLHSCHRSAFVQVFKFTSSQTPGWSSVYWWGFLQIGQIWIRPR